MILTTYWYNLQLYQNKLTWKPIHHTQVQIQWKPTQVKQLSDNPHWGRLLALLTNIVLGQDFLPATRHSYRFSVFGSISFYSRKSGAYPWNKYQMLHAGEAPCLTHEHWTMRIFLTRNNLMVTTTYVAKPKRAGHTQVKHLSVAPLWGRVLAYPQT